MNVQRFIPRSLLYRTLICLVIWLILGVCPALAIDFYGGVISSPGIYELKSDVNSSQISGEFGEITITCGNVTLHGNDHIIDGYYGDPIGRNDGIIVSIHTRQPNITVTDCIIKNCSTGISYKYVDGGAIGDITVVDSGNGIFLVDSQDITMVNNDMDNNTYNFGISASSQDYYRHVIDTSNTVDGHPIYYINGQSGTVIDASTNAGTVYAINSDSLTIRDLNLSKNLYGLCFSGTNGSTISNITALNNYRNGMYLLNSNNNTLNGGISRNNLYSGINLENSSNSTISSVDAQYNGELDDSGGIGLKQSSGNSVSDCNLNNNAVFAVRLTDSSNFNTVARNQGNTSLYAYSNSYPIEPPGTVEIDNSDDNTLIGNTLYCHNINCILLYQSDRTTINDNHLWKNTTLPGRKHYPIIAYESLFSQIIGNEIRSDGDGINTDNSSDSNRIADNTFIALGGCAFRVKNNNTITGNYADGRVPFGMGSSTEFHVEGNDNLLFNNTLYFANGICVKGDNNRIIQNTIRNSSSFGISDDTSYSGSGLFTNGNIANNTITGGYSGMTINNGNNVTIRNNSIEYSNGFDGYGLALSDLNNSTIRDNTLKNNLSGIWFSRSANNILTGNRVETPDSMYSYAFDFTDIADNTIYNNFLLNDKNIRLSGSNQNNTWNVTSQLGPNIFGGPNIGGNLWASPYGTGFSQQHEDRGDGFCDSPYFLETGSTDNLPLAGRTVLPAPVVTAIDPSTGTTGSYVVIDGVSGTGFLENASVSLNRTGYGSVFATDVMVFDTVIFCRLNLTNVTPGTWDVVVVNPDSQGGIGIGLFNVTAGSLTTPTVNTLTPTSGVNSTSVSVTINGTNFAGSVATKVNLTRGGTTIVGTSVVVTGTTKITCTFPIPGSATPGLWDLTVTNITSGATGTKANAFTIYSGQPPTISAVSPVSGNKNTTIAFSLTGANFKVGSVVNFTNSTFPGVSQVTVLDPVTSATKITGNVTFLATAPSGKWNVVVTVPDGRNATKTGVFTLNRWTTPTVTTVSPVSGSGNTTVPFTLTGTNYQVGAVVNFTNSTYGTVTTTLSSVSSTKITGNATFPAVASSGKWNINVTTPDGGTGTKAGAFTVNKWLQPSTTSVSPVSGSGNTTVPFTLTGTNYQAGAVVNFTNSTYGAVTTTLSYITSTKITGNATFPVVASSGKWNIDVITPDGGTGTKAGAFTVNSWPKPTISTVSPVSGYGNTTVAFTLTGTNYQAGAVVNFSNSTYGIVTTTLSSVSSTKITGNATFPVVASSGKWNINVTTPDGGTGTKLSAFTVNKWLQPSTTSVSPVSGYGNTTVAFTLAGTYYQAGAVVNFTNSTYGTVTTVISSITSTKITGNATFPAVASSGKWNINVTTPDGGTGTKAGAFTVNKWPKPTISSITPTIGANATTVSFTLNGNYFQGGSVVNLTNTTAGNLTASVTSATLTQIKGTVWIPGGRKGAYGLEVKTPDGGVGSVANKFTVK